MNDILKRFKELTGIKGSDVARKFNVSRQYIHQLERNYSLTYKSALYAMLSIMADDEIARMEAQIKQIKQLITEISAELLAEEGD